jgi:hypothetical protein
MRERLENGYIKRTVGNINRVKMGKTGDIDRKRYMNLLKT